MATATQVLTAVEGIGGEARRSMSRQAREARDKTALIVNTGIDRWSAGRDYGIFTIPERHAWTPAVRCAICSGERETHEADMENLEEALRKREADGKNIDARALRGHEFVEGAEACSVCLAPRSLHSPDGRYGVLLVRGAISAQDWGDKKKHDETVYADEIARDLIGASGLLSRGAFMARGARPTERELAEAETRRNNGYVLQVQEADSIWMRYHAIHLITDFQKRACEELLRLGLLDQKREWLYTLEAKIDCPRCGAKLKPGVAMCMSCGAVLDREKFDAYEAPAAPAEAAEALAPPEPAKKRSRPSTK